MNWCYLTKSLPSKFVDTGKLRTAYNLLVHIDSGRLKVTVEIADLNL